MNAMCPSWPWSRACACACVCVCVYVWRVRCRSSLAGFLKLLLVGGDTAPALLRNVYYHPDRRAEMVFMW